MNVSLTAIALLWNAADQLAKLSSHGGCAGGGAPQAPAGSPGPGEALSAAHLEALLRQLFSALQVCAPACLLRPLAWPLRH
jgi:hypothetical protein